MMHGLRVILRKTTRRACRGMTLIELLISALLLAIGAAALLFGNHYAVIHADYLRQAQIAMNAAQGRLDQLSSLSFNTLWENGSAGGTFGQARTTRMRIAADRYDLNGDGDNVDTVDGWLAVQIRPVPLQNPLGTPNPNPSVLDLHVAACWISRGRVIGEGGAVGAIPQCLDTVADDAVPGVPSWVVNSPVMVSTRIAQDPT